MGDLIFLDGDAEVGASNGIFLASAGSVLEIKKGGWAFGHIEDLEAWYKHLTDGSKLLPEAAQLSVTGYSLGVTCDPQITNYKNDSNMQILHQRCEHYSAHSAPRWTCVQLRKKYQAYG